MRAIGVREIAAWLNGDVDSTRSNRRRPAGDAPLCEAAVHLVRASASAKAGRAFANRSMTDQLASAGAARSEAPRRTAMELLRDSDIDMAPLAGKRVAILGYGNQGRAQALNLKDSGVDVVVGLRGASGSARAAEEAGLEVALVEDAAGIGRRRHVPRPRRGARRHLQGG